MVFASPVFDPRLSKLFRGRLQRLGEKSRKDNDASLEIDFYKT